MKTISKIRSILFLLVIIGCNKDDAPNTNQQTITKNQPPIANAGPDQKVIIGATVRLNAVDSKDPEKEQLSYKWEIVSKPQGSIAELTGTTAVQAEFPLDKAGVYTIVLTVSDGEIAVADEIKITNKTPIINRIDGFDRFDAFTKGRVSSRGDNINISAVYLSPDISEIKVTIGNEVCQLEYSGDQLEVELPINVKSGNLVLSVGNETVTFEEPIYIVTHPITEFSNSVLLDMESDSGTVTYEIGCMIRPLKNGTILGFKAVYGNQIRYSVWEVASGNLLGSASGNGSDVRNLDTPIPVEMGKEYLITANFNSYRSLFNAAQQNIYPHEVFDEVQVTGYGLGLGTDQIFPNTIIRENYATPYVADIHFVAEL